VTAVIAGAIGAAASVIFAVLALVAPGAAAAVAIPFAVAFVGLQLTNPRDLGAELRSPRAAVIVALLLSIVVVASLTPDCRP
jgi:hypothetical protein